MVIDFPLVRTNLKKLPQFFARSQFCKRESYNFAQDPLDPIQELRSSIIYDGNHVLSSVGVDTEFGSRYASAREAVFHALSGIHASELRKELESNLTDKERTLLDYLMCHGILSNLRLIEHEKQTRFIKRIIEDALPKEYRTNTEQEEQPVLAKQQAELLNLLQALSLNPYDKAYLYAGIIRATTMTYDQKIPLAIKAFKAREAMLANGGSMDIGCEQILDIPHQEGLFKIKPSFLMCNNVALNRLSLYAESVAL